MLNEFTILPVKQIAHGEQIAMLGSCFSENMASYFRNAGFSVFSNPYGTIFHPVPLLNILSQEPEITDFINREDLWFSLCASRALFGFSSEELKDKLLLQRNELFRRLGNASTLVVTLGSAHGYRLKTTGEIVANCHKLPKESFTRELSEIRLLEETIIGALKKLEQQFPHLQVVLTLSPVRYKRDGWVENQLSKARLLEAIHQAVTSTNAVYFPAYELVIDLLCDYSWFAEDGVHPNEKATGQVFELFQQVFFSEDTQAIVREGNEIRKLFSHRLLYPGSKEAERFTASINKKRESFLSRCPEFIW